MADGGTGVGDEAKPRSDERDGAAESTRADEAPNEPLLSFAVPEDLLREAVIASNAEDAVADLQMMPGVGEGKPPPMMSIFRRFGWAPVTYLTLAAFVVAVLDNGLTGTLAPDIQRSFRINDAELGAAIFAASAAQIGIGLPIALWSDRGSRVKVAAFCLFVFAVAVSLQGRVHSIWLFALLGIIGAFGKAPNNTTHLSYQSDHNPPEARARIQAYQRGHEPIARTLGLALIGGVAAWSGSWRWATLLALFGIPVGLLVLRLKEPKKGQHESSHILEQSGLDIGEHPEGSPRVLLGAAIQRLQRIRSLYFQLMAVAVLGFVGLGIPIFGALYLDREWHQNTAERTTIYTIIGISAFFVIPVAGFVGDRMFRRKPESVLYLGGGCLVAFGAIYVGSLYAPKLWMVVLGWFLAECALAPLGTAIFQTVAATVPADMRTLGFAMFGVYGLVIGGFAGAVILGAISNAAGHLHGPKVALTVMGPVCMLGGFLLVLGARWVRHDITLVIEDVLERYQEGQRRKAGGEIPALQIHNLDFAYGTQQVLFDIDLEVAEGEIAALLGTNGAGKSTLLRAVAGLDHPTRGTIRLFGAASTWLEAEQILDMGCGMLVGGRMTFPSLSVRENLRLAAFSFRKDKARAQETIDEALNAFPALEARIDAAAGTLSGGEQQMLALARVLLTRPRLLMIDELTLGLAPKTVEDLVAIVRRVNAEGTTVLLVEQSVNLALSLADHSFFIERGEIRFDGRTRDLLARDDLLRPVFLTASDLGTT
jgi:ABC-type branched-subunit amino acid transport system ATPase component/predicted MFS family arabinose efflux permease